MNEQARRAQVRQMLDAELLRFTRRVERVRQQEKARDKIWFAGAEHCCLAPSIGMAAKKDLPVHLLSDYFHRVAQSEAVTFRVSGKWSAGTSILTVRQIATQDRITDLGKRFAKDH